MAYKLCFALFLLLCAASAGASAPDITTEGVTWANGEVRLEGTLYLPKGTGRAPAAIFLHGSGQMGRIGNAGNRVLFNHAEQLAAQGIAVLIYDKRGVGKSTGDFRLAGFDVLTGDAAGGLAQLRAHPRIDPARIGVIGLSQGGWLATQLVERGEKLAFAVMLTAGPPVTPAEQEIFVQTHRLTSAGVPAGDVTAALAAIRKAFVVYRTDSGWNELKADVAALSAKPWYPKTPLAIASRDDAWWKWYASFMDYDPRPALAKMTVPIFVALGENDALFDREAMSREWANVAALPSHDVAVHVYPGAGHALRAGSGTEQPAAYWTDLAAWLTEKRLR